jgi:hypothetical protein
MKRGTLPWAKKHLENENPGIKVSACSITSAQFTKQSLELLEVYSKGNLKPQLVDVFYDGNNLL